MYIGSADWMDRNLSRRVEVVFPIEQPDLKQRLIDEMLATSLADNAKARELLADGSYRRIARAADQPALRSQERFLEIAIQNAQRRLIETTPQPAPVLAAPGPAWAEAPDQGVMRLPTVAQLRAVVEADRARFAQQQPKPPGTRQ